MSFLLKDGVLHLNGCVGPDLFEDFFTASDVVLALAHLDDASDLTVKINSPGGYASEGAAIYNALRARAGKTHVIITGAAISSGSLIAMAGDRITMAEGAVMMIHEPMVSLLSANSTALDEAVRAQAAHMNAYVSVYARRSKKSPSDIRAMLRQTTWFDPQQAVDAGFADDIEGAADTETPAFDYSMYAKAPQQLVAMAAAKKWNWAEGGPVDGRAERARADRAEARLSAVQSEIEEIKATGIADYESKRTGPGGRATAAGLAGRAAGRKSTPRPNWGDFITGAK